MEICTLFDTLDNVFIERPWRSSKYEDIYLKGYAVGREVRTGISLWMAFDNDRRWRSGARV